MAKREPKRKPKRKPKPQAGKDKNDLKKKAPQPPSKGRLSPDGFPVVGIGASAGGLEALEELFRPMPARTGMAFVVVTHQHPGHTSMLPELLGKCSKMPVVGATDGVKLAPDQVYVGPPGTLLSIMNGKLHLTEAGGDLLARLPIDHFFRSLAEDQQERAICIVLSGTGTDGTLGLRTIKGESGMAMVQDAQSAKYAGMPSSAAATGLADYVLPPARMPEHLIAYVRGPYLKAPEPAPKIVSMPAEPVEKVLLLVRNRTGHDFSSYKASTIRRRIERRMNVHQIEKLRDYARYLQQNEHETDILFQELLISVTSFFRDPAAFEALAAHLPSLLDPDRDSSVRAWVPGCSTGEEAYSIAILLRECVAEHKKPGEIQIFATDIDAGAIEKARSGVYPDGIAVDVSRQRLDRYFVREDGSYRIRKDVREMVVFAPQNVIKDPPFTKLDLISCRNLLIYLNSDLQRRLVPIFHYALKPNGILFLGPSETIGGFADLFATLDAKWKIYRRKETPGAVHAHLEFPARVSRLGAGAAGAPSALPPLTESATSGVVEKLLLSRFAPASVLVNDRGDIVYVHGRLGDYLEPASGRPRLNVLEMARGGLHLELAGAIHEAVAHKSAVSREQVRVEGNGSTSYVDLTVEKVGEPESLRGLLLVSFRRVPEPSPPARKKGARAAPETSRVVQLERELRHTKGSLRTTVEELETSNEELKSTNEELQSMNEELQSTNEELETSKEEMQSLNEELTTVNAELQSKVDELSQANDDMQNLLNSTELATVFLDRDLKIKRFTERATKIINLIPTDVGRPVRDLVSNLRYPHLLSDAREVLKTLCVKEEELQTVDEHWYLMRMMPYRTADNVIDGVVLTFVDIDRTKKAELVSRERGAYFEGIVEAVREPLLVLDAGLRVISANPSFYRTFGTSEKKIKGELVYDLGNGQWNIPALRRLLKVIIPENGSFDDYRVEHDFPRIGHRVMLLNARRITAREGTPALILLAVEDVTERRAAAKRG
jgi:two-component system CheB/CheR fusion protein